MTDRQKSVGGRRARSCSPKHRHRNVQSLPAKSVLTTKAGHRDQELKERLAMLPLRVEHRSIESLRPYPRNPRTHSELQIRQIADSIRLFGFTNPILIDRANGVIAGHGRVAAARLLGMDRVPTILLDHMTTAEKRAYILADNRLAELAGWDNELLALELAELSTLELDFDLTVTGFAAPEIDFLIEGPACESDDPAADEVPSLEPKAPPVSRSGDLWCLGRHRLLCGDTRDPGAVARLMAGERAQLVFTDPPYNLAIEGHACGLGRIRHPEFAMACGEMSEPEFLQFLRRTLGNLAAHSQSGAIHFVCMDWRHLYELLGVGRAIYAELKNLCIWNKSNGGMGGFYRAKHELIAVFKVGTARHINNIELGRHGRYRTNVWDYAGVNTLKADRDEELAMHPTVKPAALIADAILDCSRRGGRVLDGFAGSGTTLIAAEKTGRCGYALEFDGHYVDVALRRWCAYTGNAATHAETGLSFEQVAVQRAEAPSSESKPRRGRGARHGG